MKSEDAISRAEAIRVASGYCHWTNIPTELAKLPSVTPKHCEDAIRREDALMALTGEWTELTDEIIHRFIRRIRTLPPVTPQPKTGHWIPIYGNVKCSVCGSVKDSRNVGAATHYCDFCGAKMVEPQESEELREKNISKGFEDFMIKVLREQEKAESEE